jgi:signal transduction histidine kinase
MKHSGLSILWKILLSTSVALTVLFALTGLIVQNHVINTTSQSLEEEVTASFQAYESLWRSRAEKLASVSLTLSLMSDVRSAFSTGDQATIRDTAGELWVKISDENALFLVTDPRGRIIAYLGGAPQASLSKEFSAVRAAVPQFPKQSIGFTIIEGRLYQIVVTPVYVQAGLINVLVAGYAIDALVAQNFKQSTGSEFLFLVNGKVAASTLNGRATAALAARAAEPWQGGRISDGVIEYAPLWKPLIDVDGKRIGELWIFRSFESARLRIAALRRDMFLMWFVAVAAGLWITYLLARRIVEPVLELDRAAAEVSRQNYAFRVREETGGELGRLARTFNQMCESIQNARAELIRQERISTIGRLSSSIVHDLRNPLAAIYGGAEMLVDTELSPPQVKRLAANIYRASRRIQEMLQDLVNVSRGKTRGSESCRLREVVAAAVEASSSAAESQGVEIAVNVPAGLELPLERARIERVFLNLIANALEVMPRGGKIRIFAAEEDASAVIRVEDTGPGIPPGVRSRLFEPFVTAGKKNGLGLGLALSRQAIQDHGGEMWIEPSESGARFAIRLPVAGAKLAGC